MRFHQVKILQTFQNLLNDPVPVPNLSAEIQDMKIGTDSSKIPPEKQKVKKMSC